MGQMLYLECAFGISGDRVVAALLDLGADEQALRKALENLPVDGFQIRVSRVKKNGIDACNFQVHPDEPLLEHDGASRRYPARRGLPEVLEILRQAEMTKRAKSLAEKIFRILAEAEAHGISAESIVTILAAAVCLDNLDITEAVIPKLCEGSGIIRCPHGIVPIPVPVVLNIVQEHELPIQITQAEGELVTPAGAAIAAAVRAFGELPSKFTVKKTGIGAGRQDCACAGILRAMLLETEDGKGNTDVIYKLEANIDDCTGERLGYAMECLFQAGARDVHYTPVFMKKNRPAYQLNVICGAEDVSRLEEIIFRETTTIGIRRMQIERSVMQREVKEVDTSLGKALVKICGSGSNRWIYPEYESIARLAREHGLPYEQVNRLVIQEAR